MSWDASALLALLPAIHQMRDAEFASDGAGDKTVGGGDDGHQVLGRGMAGDQFASFFPDLRSDADLHELGVPQVQLVALVAGQRR
jgi:hypothetical protein